MESYSNEEIDMIEEAVKYFIQHGGIESRDREDDKYGIKARDLFMKICSEYRY